MPTHKVELYIYDLTRGLARQYASMLAPGLDIDGVWHTAIVCYGTEWFYGAGFGIETCTPPGTTSMGAPLRIETLGTTSISEFEFRRHLHQLGQGRFSGNRYDLFRHNCNNFSDEIAGYLCGKRIPQYILDLPGKVLNSPVAQILAPIIQNATPHGTNFEQEIPSRSSVDDPLIQSDYVGFSHKIDSVSMMRKLLDINIKNSENNRFNESTLDALTRFLKDGCDFVELIWPSLELSINSWPAEDIFPLLDTLRYAISLPDIGASTSTKTYAICIRLLKDGISNQQSSIVSRLVFKILCNFFLRSITRTIIVDDREDLIALTNQFVENRENIQDQQLQVGIATLCLNFAVYFRNSNSSSDGPFQIISALVSEYMNKFTFSEAAYRSVTALGTLIHMKSDVKDLALALEAPNLLSRLFNRFKEDEKVRVAIDRCKKAIEN